MKKYLGPGIVIVILGLIVFLVAKNVIIKASQENQRIREISFSVNVMKAQKTDLTEIIHAQSIVKGNPQVLVFPNAVTGLFIKNNFTEGDSIRKGADIADIDRNTPGGFFNTAPVESPIDGMIIKLFYMDKGSSVSLTQPIAEVANPDSIKIEVELSEAQLFKVKVGLPVTVIPEDQPNKRIRSKISFVDPFIDLDTLSGTVIMFFDNRSRSLEIGTLVDVDIEIGQKRVFLVPQSAVLMGQADTHVFLNKNNTAKQVYIRTGYIDHDMIEVTGDINEGDEIITDGSFKVFDDAKIRVISAAESDRPIADNAKNGGTKKFGSTK